MFFRTELYLEWVEINEQDFRSHVGKGIPRRNHCL